MVRRISNYSENIHNMSDKKVEKLVQDQVTKTVEASLEAFAAKFMLPFQASITKLSTIVGELANNQSEVKDML